MKKLTLSELEISTLDGFYRNIDLKGNQTLSHKNITKVSLRVVLEIMKIIQSVQIGQKEFEQKTKPDGSPVTNIDLECETLARNTFEEIFSGIGFNGEEFPETPSKNDYRVILDPVDGTNALISGEPRVGVNLAVQHNKKIILSIVANPATGEICYTFDEKQTRLLQLENLGLPHSVRILPDKLEIGKKSSRVLTRLRYKGLEFEEAVKKLTENGTISHMISPGGSAALEFIEASKGAYILVSTWRTKSSPHDHTGAELVRKAGGKVIDIDGNDLPLEGHIGPYLAGIDLERLENTRIQLKKLLKN